MANYQSHTQKESLSLHSTTGLTVIQFNALVKPTHQLPDLGYPKRQIPALYPGTAHPLTYALKVIYTIILRKGSYCIQNIDLVNRKQINFIDKDYLYCGIKIFSYRNHY